MQAGKTSLTIVDVGYYSKGLSRSATGCTSAFGCEVGGEKRSIGELADFGLSYGGCVKVGGFFASEEEE